VLATSFQASTASLYAQTLLQAAKCTPLLSSLCSQSSGLTPNSSGFGIGGRLIILSILVFVPCRLAVCKGGGDFAAVHFIGGLPSSFTFALRASRLAFTLPAYLALEGMCCTLTTIPYTVTRFSYNSRLCRRLTQEVRHVLISRIPQPRLPHSPKMKLKEPIEKTPHSELSNLRVTESSRTYFRYHLLQTCEHFHRPLLVFSLLKWIGVCFSFKFKIAFYH
jgi:hypothetical protein